MDVADLISAQGLDVQRASGGRELVIECPFCGRPKFYISADKGLWTCHRCGERGNLWTLATKALGLSNYDAFRLTREIEKGLKDAPRFIQQEARLEEPEVELPDGFRRLLRRDSALDEMYWQYLRSRGLTDDVVRAYGLGIVPMLGAFSSKYMRRIIVPVRQDGKLRTWVARSVYSSCPSCSQDPCRCRARWLKTLFPAETRMALLLFNYDRMQSDQEIVLTEGIWDALRLPERCVASFGAHLSQEQRLLLRRKTNRLVLCWDGDEAGQLGAQRVARELASDLFSVRVAHLPDGQDPGSLPVQELERHISLAEPFDLVSTRG